MGRFVDWWCKGCSKDLSDVVSDEESSPVGRNCCSAFLKEFDEAAPLSKRWVCDLF